MKRSKFFARLFLGFCIPFFVLCTTTGCANLYSGSQEKENKSISGFAFDTTYTITLYQGGSQDALNHCVSLCTKYENIFSNTREDSELYQINQMEKIYEKLWNQIVAPTTKTDKITKEQQEKLQNMLEKKLQEKNWEQFQAKVTRQGNLKVKISDDLSQILDRGLYYCSLSDGKFDITIAPVSSLWDFSSGEGTVPAADKIKEALQYVDYKKIKLKNTSLTLQCPGMQIDLGGIAKGYIADRLKEYLVGEGVTGGIIDLGGNILCIGGKTEQEDFKIGIRQPFADRNETIASVSIRDKSVVSSGVYERYIQTEDGKIYHHILEPRTGYSYENGLLGVTIISDKSVDGDGLSTTVFALGLEDGMKLVESLDGVEAAFVTEDEKVTYSKDFELLSK